MLRLITTSMLALATLAVGQNCPANPGTDPAEPPFGSPIPPRPEDIPAGCSEFEILSARGTSENGKFGYRVGDVVIGNVTEVLPGSRGYPVQYPASSDFNNSVAQGGRDVAARIESQSSLCPEQNFSLIGYSQGAMVMRNGLELIPESLYDRIKSIVLFGDPYFQDPLPEALEDKLLENCAGGDQVCDKSGASCPYAHISYTYPEWIEATEEFIVDKFTV